MDISYKIINHEIRNFKLLNINQLNNLNNFSKEELIAIIKTYNEVQNILNDILDDNIKQSSSYK